MDGHGNWFSLEVKPEWAPWAFAKDDPNKVIAALELLATLIEFKLWVTEKNANQSNEALLRKAMTTKFPSTLVLMELAEELSAKNYELQLQWICRT